VLIIVDYEAQYIVDGQVYERLLDAVGLSCEKQRVACLDAAAKWGYLPPLDGHGCSTEVSLVIEQIDNELIGSNIKLASVQPCLSMSP
jgi:hypothetical protein